MSDQASNGTVRNDLQREFKVLYAGGDPRLFPNRDFLSQFGPKGTLILSIDELSFHPSDKRLPSLSWPDVSIRTVAYKPTFLDYAGYTVPAKDIILDSQLRDQIDAQRISERKTPYSALRITVDDPARVLPFLSVYFCFDSKYYALVAAKRMLSMYVMASGVEDDAVEFEGED